MAKVLICPACRRRLQVSDRMLGQRISCPGCSWEFMAMADAPEQESTDEMITEDSGDHTSDTN